MTGMRGVAAVMAVMGAVSLSLPMLARAEGAATSQAEAKLIRGRITKLDTGKVTITTEGAKATEKLVNVTDKTEITINGEKKGEADLMMDLYVTVTVEGDHAKKLAASTTEAP